MSSVTYLYDAGSTVFHVDENTGVREALVVSVTINITAAGTSISYNIAYKKAIYGSALVAEDTLYGDVDSALAAYKPLVDVP